MHHCKLKVVLYFFFSNDSSIGQVWSAWVLPFLSMITDYITLESYKISYFCSRFFIFFLYHICSFLENNIVKDMKFYCFIKTWGLYNLFACGIIREFYSSSQSYLGEKRILSFTSLLSALFFLQFYLIEDDTKIDFILFYFIEFRKYSVT